MNPSSHRLLASLLLGFVIAVIPCERAGAQVFEVTSLAEITTGSYDSYPRWSPDGSTILFARGRDYTIYNDGLSLYRVNSDGSGVSLIMAAGDVVNLIPSGWEPTSQRVLAFYDRVLDIRVITMAAADGSALCTLLPANARMPDLSWDGASLAYSAGTYYGAHTGVRMDVSGCSITNPVTITTSAPAMLKFSPDGQKVAFVTTGPEGKPCLAIVNRDGTGLDLLAHGADSYAAASWRSTGDYIACLSNRDQAVASRYDIWIIDVSNKQMQRLTSSGDIGSFDWSRDGQKMAVSRTDSNGNQALYVLGVSESAGVSDWSAHR